MRGATIRSGLVESTHPWSAVVVDDSGVTLHEWGEPDRPIFYRSSIKPFQATISQEQGAALPPEHLALACASHSGAAAHVAIVDAILAGAGLGPAALGCPADWPLSPAARHLLVAAGHRRQRIFHNCSGKHAGFLAACVAQGWDTAGYLSPDHPLQRRVIELLAEVTGVDPRPIGVDGCGAPAVAGTLRGLARAFAQLGVEPRFEPAATAMVRFPALTSGNERPDGKLAMWWGGPVKGGAQGVVAAARNGIAVAAKSHGGSIEVAVMALVHVAATVGLIAPAALDGLDDVRTPAVLGGGRPVGSMVPDVEHPGL